MHGLGAGSCSVVGFDVDIAESQDATVDKVGWYSISSLSL